MPLTREPILRALEHAMRPLPYVHSMFEAGSAAFGRLDAYSDIDLEFDVDDGHEDEAFAVLEVAIEALSPVQHRWVLPLPQSHGMAQRFYRLAATDEWLLLDVCMRPTSKPGHFSEPELHGEPIVYFDKGEFVRPIALDRAKVKEERDRRLDTLRQAHPMLSNLARKEALRGRVLDAYGFYHAMVLRPLIELLRMRYTPDRWNFAFRYLDFEFPPEVLERLRPLAHAKNLEELIEKSKVAEAWGAEELAFQLAAQQRESA